MEFLGEEPFELSVLSPYVKTKEKTHVGWVVTLDWDRHFEKLLLSSKRLSISFESVRRYIAMHNVVKQEDMDEGWKRCYPKLLGTGVALTSTGLIFRKSAFETSPAVQTIRESLPHVVVLDDSLADSLNNDPELRELISQIRPEVFTADLSLSTEDLPEGADLGSVLSSPSDVTWAVTVERQLSRGIGVKKTLMSVMDMMDIAVVKAEENSRRIRDASSKD